MARRMGILTMLLTTMALVLSLVAATGATATGKDKKGGGEGCTPGYWKQDHHLDSWVGTGYSPSQTFSSVFGVGPSTSLLTALGTGGGGANALGRHAVAALLNSASGGVDYGLSTAQVIQIVQAAYASGNYEAAKNILAALNEVGCPLN